VVEGESDDVGEVSVSGRVRWARLKVNNATSVS
jgi:hypothetical protein